MEYNNERKSTTIYIDVDTWETFKEICRAEDRSASKSIRDFIREVIRRERDAEKYREALRRQEVKKDLKECEYI